MKKMLLGAVGLSAFLASCGSGVAPDGSGSGSVTQVKTEYRTQSGQYVACDNFSDGVTVSQRTQVAVYFNVSGNVQTVDVGLRGNTNSDYDGNYNATATGQQLADAGNGSYRLTFNATPQNGFLPQSIIVTPTRAKVKIVSVDQKVGSFHAALKVNTGSATYSFSSRLIAGGNVDVYTGCNQINTTNEDV